jgi:DNA-binding IclR family transcriptional regulator
MDAKLESKNELLSSVARTMSILEILGRADTLSLTEIAEGSGLHKSTAFRFVQTLLQLGYIFRDEANDRYGLSLKLNALAGTRSGSRDILRYASSALESLSRETGETVHLAVLEDGDLIYLRKIESNRVLRVVTMTSSVGGGAPMYCTGLGKAVLAFFSLQEQERYIAHQVFTRFTARTITDGPALLGELALIREQGYAFDRQEHEEGVVCVAAPIFGSGQLPLGAISVAGPSVRMGEEELRRYTALILEASREISAKLGQINRNKTGFTK